MLELRLSELAQSLGVACKNGDAVVTGLAIDSKAVKPGDLFVAEHYRERSCNKWSIPQMWPGAFSCNP